MPLQPRHGRQQRAGGGDARRQHRRARALCRCAEPAAGPLHPHAVGGGTTHGRAVSLSRFRRAPAGWQRGGLQPCGRPRRDGLACELGCSKCPFFSSGRRNAGPPGSCGTPSLLATPRLQGRQGSGCCSQPTETEASISQRRLACNPKAALDLCARHASCCRARVFRPSRVRQGTNPWPRPETVRGGKGFPRTFRRRAGVRMK